MPPTNPFFSPIKLKINLVSPKQIRSSRFGSLNCVSWKRCSSKGHGKSMSVCHLLLGDIKLYERHKLFKTTSSIDHCGFLWCFSIEIKANQGGKKRADIAVEHIRLYQQRYITICYASYVDLSIRYPWLIIIIIIPCFYVLGPPKGRTSEVLKNYKS